MAITIDATSLIQPRGELDCDYFPDSDLDSKIGGWLSQAKAKVLANADIVAAKQDEAVAQWVYYLAFSYIANRFAAMPNSVSTNNGADSVSYGQDRVTYWATRAAAALAAYEGSISVQVLRDSRRPMVMPVKVIW